ncbi:hypothetical protein [Marinilactibacillus sp. XAAS-LB27]|uniref:hypothetical protein n=1 Tax=Marinilactibacillus sp. XAAS-LB27 TaxID=3114538 RepID=UPI002E173A52
MITDMDMMEVDPFSNMLQYAERTMMINVVFQIVMIILAVVVIAGVIYGLVLLRQFLNVYKANSEQTFKRDNQ